MKTKQKPILFTPSFPQLEKHMETHVKRQLATESMFQCDACGKEVQGKKRLRIHKRTHFQFKCQPCNKIFKDEVSIFNLVNLVYNLTVNLIN